MFIFNFRRMAFNFTMLLPPLSFLFVFLFFLCRLKDQNWLRRLRLWGMTTDKLGQLWVRSLRIYSLCGRLLERYAVQTLLVAVVVYVHQRKSLTVVYVSFPSSVHLQIHHFLFLSFPAAMTSWLFHPLHTVGTDPRVAVLYATWEHSIVRGKVNA